MNLADIQTGVTGKCKHNQEPYESMILELEEELGLRWTGTDLIQGIQTEDSRGNERTIFKIPISSLIYIYIYIIIYTLLQSVGYGLFTSLLED